ncbi:MAG: hypothetical protein QXI20_08410, partial [Candidatus Jordarchaeales archaeon]
MNREKCGVIGIYAFDENWNVSRFIYYGLVALQNRGQETCGMAVFDGKNMKVIKGKGLAENFFTQNSLDEAKGWAGIGHVSPLNPQFDENIQPVYINDDVKVALGYNGKVLNYKELVEGKFKSEEDAVAVASLLAKELKHSDPLEAMESAMEKMRGAYSLVAFTDKGEMIVARDPKGVKPLVIGSFGFDHGAIASESAAIDVIGADLKADIKPGEIYVINQYTIERKSAFRDK